MVELTENDTSSEIVTGSIKWFDPVKGFGFVVCDNDMPDILLHANVLRNYGQSSVADNATIRIRVQKTARGYQAIEVLSVVPPEPPEPGGSGFLMPVADAELEACELLPARVKWFDAAKGFGFANTFGNNRDVFIHIDLLRRSGLAGLMPGEAIAIKVVDGDRGRMAIEVSGWERAAKDT